jgi:hypothetical protein
MLMRTNEYNRLSNSFMRYSVMYNMALLVNFGCIHFCKVYIDKQWKIVIINEQ